MNIVILDGYTTNPGDLPFTEFKKMGNLTVYDYTPDELTIERCKGADIIIGNKTNLPKEVLENISAKYIGLFSTGYNVVDIETASKLGITVCNVPAYSTNAVAQHTFALILELYNHVGLHSALVRDGKWSDPEKFCFWDKPLYELTGKTLGVIGMGSIGQKTAEIASAFGMKVIFANRSKKDYLPYPQVSLDELYKTADIISLHCPLTPETTGMIDKNAIDKMKKNAIIINTSRGPAINEQDLADSLNSGRIMGAGVDVLSTEPPKEDNPLLTAKNCLITPHIAWAAHETRERCLGIAVQNVKNYLNGTPTNVVSNL